MRFPLALQRLHQPRAARRVAEPEHVFRAQYVESVLCLKSKPSELGLNTTRYDNFPYVHNRLNHISEHVPFSRPPHFCSLLNRSRVVHAVAMFLPWHRNFVALYEEALRDCGYTGPMVYWDWSLEADTGLGGNGNRAEGGSDRKCVADGPFKDLRPAYYGDDYAPHCLSRNWNNGTDRPGDMIASTYTPDAVGEVMASQSYQDFRYSLEGGPHRAIHAAVGGDMSPATSPNDPLFFLHHTQVDRLWWLWQQQDPAARTTAFGGPRTQDEDSLEATLEDVMPFLGLAEDVQVSELMTTQSGRLCYVY
ncbi:uncharacterized protein B0T15DRAFT_481108 [Chaetomium strumarium]|uniref:Tyrosinase copper-binding domain-containing protein n=1 Tax=Chaetomium strumarium TaxID=1170767 RepID=A0AAJ0H0A0_9PEZI|nr:hypothetical protein B0T15DRAFT_481108 [Chaetomium strumarium]